MKEHAKVKCLFVPSSFATAITVNQTKLYFFVSRGQSKTLGEIIIIIVVVVVMLLLLLLLLMLMLFLVWPF